MTVETEFTVSAPGDRVWAVLSQPDAFASVVPGSSMRALDGGVGCEGRLRVVERDCIGTLRQIDVDEDGRSTSCWFRVRDANGPGFATGLIRGRVSDANGSARVALTLEGRLAAPGTDETKVQDQAEKLLASLAESLEASLAKRASKPATEPAPVATPAQAPPSPATSAPASSGPPAALVGAGILALLFALVLRRRGRRSRLPW